MDDALTTKLSRDINANLVALENGLNALYKINPEKAVLLLGMVLADIPERCQGIFAYREAEDDAEGRA